MNELEAVQMLLRAIGSSPVNSLDVAHPDVANARASLNRLRKSVQKRGWWFNQDYNVVFQVNSVGEVTIPKEITKFVSDNVSLVKRGRKVYNTSTQTFLINTNVRAIKTVRTLEWEDMPASMQEYAAYLACAQFISDEIEDTNKEEKYQRLAGISKIDVDEEDLDSAKVNVFNNSRVSRARGGVTPYQSRSTLRPNDYS
tara:strand:+ start:7466 stop:8062 length:597 start_codon:yes stop_codon:yes gene_type:complete